MKLKYKQLENESFDTVYVKRTDQPHLGKNWHFHQEYELIYFLEGQGIRIVGDHLSNFSKGELVLVGEWLPHLWRNEPTVSNQKEADYIIIKFLKSHEGINFFEMPEFFEIQKLLKRSQKGLLFSQQIASKVHDIIIEISQNNSFEKFLNLLKLLQILAEEDEALELSNLNFSQKIQNSSESRLQNVINYIFKNYAEQITLEDIADLSNMTVPAFCRFFKNCTNKTFINFLNEFRVGKACQFLISDEKSIKEICFEIGFNSITNFNRTFRTFKEMTPTDYRDKYMLIRA